MPITKKSGVNIHHQCEGNPTHPPLLMIHGNGNCLDDWYHLGFVKQLSAYFYLILVDMRGYGKSAKPLDPSAYTPTCVASDIIAVLNELNIQQCHYFGNSRGGDIAFIMSKRHPERFLSYIIGGAQPYGNDQPQSHLSDEINWLQQGVDYFVTKIEAALGQNFPAGVRENFLHNNPQAMIAANIARAKWPNDSDCFIKNPRVPRTLLYGEFDELASVNEIYKQQDPACGVIVLEGLSHAQAYWYADKISPPIIDFIYHHFPIRQRSYES